MTTLSRGGAVLPFLGSRRVHPVPAYTQVLQKSAKARTRTPAQATACPETAKLHLRLGWLHIF